MKKLVKKLIKKKKVIRNIKGSLQKLENKYRNEKEIKKNREIL